MNRDAQEGARPRIGPRPRTVLWVAAVTLSMSLMSIVAASAATPSAASPRGWAAPASSGSFSGPLLGLPITWETGAAIGGLGLGTAPDPSTSTTVVVTLPIQDPEGLQSFVRSVSNPDSPGYAHFLSHTAFDSRFSPPASEQRLVASYLASEGLHLRSLSPDHLTIVASGTLGSLAAAFHISFANYARDGQRFYAPTSAPEVPAALAPWVFGVAGLTDYNFGLLPQVAAPLTGGVAGSGVQDFPDQEHFEFQLNQLYNATGTPTTVVPTYAQGVVIVQGLWSGATGQCGYSISDISNFFNNSTGYPGNLPKPTTIPHYQIPGYPGNAPASGHCASAGVNSTNSGVQEAESPAIELTLDQEYSGIDAPGANLEPTWVNGTGPAATDPPLEALTSWVVGGNVSGLDVFTNSWGGGESADTNGSFEAVMEQDYQEAAATGVTVLASSGDSNGAEGPAGNGQAVCGSGPASEGVPGIDYPGSSPNVLSVGGTANMGTTTAILSGQTVWNWCPSTDAGVSAGSTGGVSLAFPEAWYQQNDSIVTHAMLNAIQVTVTGNGSANSPLGVNDGVVYSNTSARPDPDVSGPAANMTIYFSQQWLANYGGTSFSSPAVAGMLGEIIAFDGHPLGQFGPALYTLEKEWLHGQVPLPPTYFVQNYSNAFFNGSTDYNTSAGWGVPLAYNLALLLGKPFLTVHPGRAHATATKPFPLHVAVHDLRPVAYVNVTYQEPGTSGWASVPLHLTKGTTTSGTWAGSIPAATKRGTLLYCVEATDVATGNSWSPYNLSAWAATHGADPSFGCTTPTSVKIYRAPAPSTVPSALLGETEGPAAPLAGGVPLSTPGTELPGPVAVLAGDVVAVPRGGPD
jgi:subtilase family serine protease